MGNTFYRDLNTMPFQFKVIKAGYWPHGYIGPKDVIFMYAEYRLNNSNNSYAYYFYNGIGPLDVIYKTDLYDAIEAGYEEIL